MTVAQGPTTVAQGKGFVHLHTHTEYSLLDGMGRIGDIVQAAKADGQPAAAITDHGTLAGAWKFAHACRAAGIKPILGQEVYLSIGSRFDPQVILVPRDGDSEGSDTDTGTKRKANEHLTVLAATPTGWLNLVKISNTAQETLFGKPLADIELLKQHSEGLIVLTGCLGGPVASYAARGDLATAEQNLLALVGAVGPQNVYVEIMDHDIEPESAASRSLAALADTHGLTMVATNDAHIVHADDRGTHDVWLASQSKTVLSSPKRFRFTGSGYHLRTEAEMRALRPGSARWQDACTATVAVAERVQDWVLPEVRYRMPRFALPDGFDTDDTYLHHLVLHGAKERYGFPLPPEVKTRLRREENVITSLGFASYFLILAELTGWARAQGILVGPGRGSACGSALAYCLKITDVEPLGADLLFERFLEEGRTDMPDIDVDFEQRRIPEIHAHLRALYGTDCVARLGTFAMARSRRAVKDVARVLERNDLGARMASMIPMDGGRPLGLQQVLDPVFEPGRPLRDLVAADPVAATILDHALTVENAVLGAGIHACGVVVSGEPLPGLIPLRKDRSGGFKDLPAAEQPWVTDWDGKDTEALGLLKLDALFLRSLDVLAETSRIIAETTGEVVDFATMPDTTDLSDARVRATWELLRQGRTSAIFQMESAGMRELLVGSHPSSLDDLSAISALYRPGPMSAGMGERYVERKSGREPVDYGVFTDDPVEQKWLDSVLGSTVGLCIAQGELVHSVTRGRQVPIEDIVVGELVQSVDDELRTQHGRVLRVMDNGMRAVVRLTLHNGDTIRLTPDHRVLTQDGWKAAGALTGADSVAAPWNLESLDVPCCVTIGAPRGANPGVPTCRRRAHPRHVGVLHQGPRRAARSTRRVPASEVHQRAARRRGTRRGTDQSIQACPDHRHPRWHRRHHRARAPALDAQLRAQGAQRRRRSGWASQSPEADTRRLDGAVGHRVGRAAGSPVGLRRSRRALRQDAGRSLLDGQSWTCLRRSPLPSQTGHRHHGHPHVVPHRPRGRPGSADGAGHRCGQIRSDRRLPTSGMHRSATGS